MYYDENDGRPILVFCMYELEARSSSSLARTRSMSSRKMDHFCPWIFEMSLIIDFKKRFYLFH